jgi:hypothetical protein
MLIKTLVGLIREHEFRLVIFLGCKVESWVDSIPTNFNGLGILNLLGLIWSSRSNQCTLTFYSQQAIPGTRTELLSSYLQYMKSLKGNKVGIIENGGSSHQDSHAGDVFLARALLSCCFQVIESNWLRR